MELLSGNRLHGKLLITALLGLCGSSVWGQTITGANVPKDFIVAYAGDPLDISCESFGKPLKMCMWERLSSIDSVKPSTLMSYTSRSEADSSSSLPGYVQQGDLEAGVCGLRADNITRHDMAKWQCTLFAQERVYRGTLSINVIHKPDAPRFSPEELGTLVDGDLFGVNRSALSCYAANGMPSPVFKWYIGDEPYKGELYPVETKELDNGNTYTFQQLKNQRFTWKEHGKKLRCVIVHDLVADDEVKETSVPIFVKFQPRSQQNSVTTVVKEVGQPVTDLDFNFIGNPKPRIYWEVDGVRISAGFSSPDKRIHALQLEQTGEATWRARLRIRDIVPLDFRRKYILKSENEIGKQDFEVCLSQNPARAGTTCGSAGLYLNLKPNGPPQQPPAPSSPPAGLSAGPEETDPEGENENEDNDHVPESSDDVIVKLKHVQEQMQDLKQQEAALLGKLAGTRSRKNAPNDATSAATAPAAVTSTGSVVAAGTATVVALPQIQLNERVARQRLMGARRRNLPKPGTETREGSEVSEVQVESAGIFIRGKKLITA